MSHFTSRNLGLCLGRQGIATNDPQWNLITITTDVIDQNAFRRGGTTVFPLYLYPSERKNLFDNADGERRANLSPEFVAELTGRLNLLPLSEPGGDLAAGITPEDIFAYAYAVFHSPAYRSRYSEFLKIDFPRLPLTSNLGLFQKLVQLGERLVKIHLLEIPLPEIAVYPAEGNNVVEAVRFDEIAKGSGRVWINPQQYFENVPAEVWNFHIGGYQVCHKWLKDRKGRMLTFDDIVHYKKIVSALSETIRLMAEIDESIEKHGGFPLK